jgi:Domain of unknown function (DUF5348)
MSSVTGRLRVNDDGRLELYNHAEYLRIPVSGGTALELFEAGRWMAGRLEHDADGYYFTGPGGARHILNATARLTKDVL